MYALMLRFLLCRPGLLDNRQNVILLNDHVLLLVYLYLSSGILGVNHLIAGLYLHGNLLAVYHAAGAYSDNLSLLGLLLSLAGTHDAGLGGLFCN